MINVQPIKSDWINQRCKPYVIPFAGIINKPDNLTISEFTNQNFQYCTQSILSSVTGTMLEPITFVVNVINGILNDIKEAINSIRAMFDKIRTFFETIVKEVMGRIMNMMIPLQEIIIGFKDLMGKIQGTMTAGLFTIIGAFYTLQALMGAIAEFIITILITLSVSIMIFWLTPFTWGAASAMTAVFLAIAIPMTIILAFMMDYLKVKPGLSIPKIKCFDKNTVVILQNGSKKKIIDVEIGDMLIDNNEVTGKIKVETKGSNMFYLNSIIVSDTHIVNYNHKWIPVCKHPLARKLPVYDEPFLYCLNTSNKTISINGYLFTDWDEIYDDDILSIKKNTYNSVKEISDIHKYLDSGFVDKTLILLKNGSAKEIRNIEIGDILYNGEIVYGVVLINGINLNEQYIFNLGNDIFVEGGTNINICDKNIDFTSTINLDKEFKEVKILKENILYHLLTDKKTFYIDKIKFYDYNASVDLFLDKSRGKLLSMKYV